MAPRDDGGVSPVVGVVFLVVIVVTLSGVVFVTVTRQADSLESPPLLTVDGDELVADCTGCAPQADQVVRLRHVSGDSLNMSEVDVVVTLPNGNTGRLTRLPSRNVSHCFGSPNNAVDPDNVEGDDVFSMSCGKTRGALTLKPPDTDGTLSPGDFLEFRVKESGDGTALRRGDVVVVKLVHESGAVVVTESIEAT